MIFLKFKHALLSSNSALYGAGEREEAGEDVRGGPADGTAFHA
jgi:hypothetical protein